MRMKTAQGNLMERNQDCLPDLAERLERGELVYFPVCPFRLPGAEDRRFLGGQKLNASLHKNISYDPVSANVSGHSHQGPEQEGRLRRLLLDFSQQASRWLEQVLVNYRGAFRLDRVHFRPEEEALRTLRLMARNDLVHLDAFPSRPSGGDRILRLFVNLNDQEPRIWATSETFAKLLARFGSAVGLPSLVEKRLGWRLRESFLKLVSPSRRQRTPYDRFMLRFHHFLKQNQEFQERGPKRFWTFAPGSAWLLFSDALSYADLRGRFVLDHSFFVPLRCLVWPEEAPALLLERALSLPVLHSAA